MPDKRSIEEIIKDDAVFKRFLEINLELLSNIARIQHGLIEHLPIKEGKLLVRKQEIKISGGE